MRREEEIVKGMLKKGLLLCLFLSLLMVIIAGKSPSTLGLIIGMFMAYLDFLSIVIFVKAILRDNSKSFFLVLQVLKYMIITIIVANMFIKAIVDPLYFVLGLLFLPVIPFLEVKKLVTKY